MLSNGFLPPQAGLVDGEVNGEVIGAKQSAGKAWPAPTITQRHKLTSYWPFKRGPFLWNVGAEWKPRECDQGHSLCAESHAISSLCFWVTREHVCLGAISIARCPEPLTLPQSQSTAASVLGHINDQDQDLSFPFFLWSKCLEYIYVSQNVLHTTSKTQAKPFYAFILMLKCYIRFVTSLVLFPEIKLKSSR